MVCFDSAHHHIESSLDTSCFQLTSILLSSDPALLRRPRLPARDMQYHRLEMDSTPGSTTEVYSALRSPRGSAGVVSIILSRAQWIRGQGESEGLVGGFCGWCSCVLLAST